PNLPASKITSGTFDRARLPAASTSQPGIVQLTNSRSSTSETLAVTAAALNAHRTSADHDDRYVTRAELGGTIPRSAVGSYTGNGASSREIDVGFAPKLVVVKLDGSLLNVPILIIMIRGGPSTGIYAGGVINLGRSR